MDNSRKFDRQEYDKIPELLQNIYKVFNIKSYGNLESEKKLLAKIIKIALTDLASDDIDQVSSAFYYFFKQSSNDPEITEFDSVCTIFNTHPEYIRKKIREYCEERRKEFPILASNDFNFQALSEYIERIFSAHSQA